MEALGIAMAILQTIGAITSTVKAAKSIYDAPDELESILNDLSEGQIMVLEIKYHLGHQKPELPLENKLHDRLREADRILSELKDLVDVVLSKPQDPTSLKRIAWLRTKKKMLKLRIKLSKIHEELSRGLGQIESSRIKLELTNISLVQQQIQTGISTVVTTGANTSQRISNLVEAQERNTEALQLSQQLQWQVSSSIDEIRGAMSQHISKILETQEQNTEVLRSTQQLHDRIVSTVDEIRNQQPSSLGSASLNSRFLIQTEQESPRSSEPPPQGYESRRTYPVTEDTTSDLQSTYHSIMIETQYRPPSSCYPTCHCCCHSKQTLRTPSIIAGLVGQMFIGYKGMPIIAKSCSIKRCKRNSEPNIYAIYSFPSWWIFNRMVLIIASRYTNLGPELIIRLPRLIHPSSTVLNFIRVEDFEGLKRLFLDGMASPNDSTDDMTSLLHYSLRMRKFAMLKFLVQAGADINIETSAGSNLSDEVCCALLEGRVPGEYKQWATETFLSCRNQDFGFSSIHEVVLGFRFTEIQDELSQLCSKASSVDDQDLWGYTALHWACARGYKQAVIKLLEFGADPNVTNQYMQTPLFLALRSGYLECALCLLRYNADVCWNTEAGWGAIHTAIFGCGSHPLIHSLLDKLDALGADINGSKAPLQTPIMIAIWHNRHIPLRWLLSHGVNYRTEFVRKVRNSTILHWAGFFADLQTIDILRENRLSGINVHSIDDAQHTTAMDQILDPARQPPASDEVMAAFVRLLSEIEARTNGKVPEYDRTEINTTTQSKIVALRTEAVVKSSTIESMLAKAPSTDSEDEEEDVFWESIEVQCEDSATHDNSNKDIHDSTD